MTLPRPDLFALDPGVSYLDNASVAPIPGVVEQVSLRAVSSKAKPWLRDRAAAQALVGQLRERAAALVGAQPEDMAITCAASYGLAIARANLPVSAGERILVLEGDHSSQALTWHAHAQAVGAVIDTVRRPVDGDWTGAILEHLTRQDGRRIALASLCETFWIDGSRVDLSVVCPVLRSRGARIVLDLTQSVGVLDVDVRALHADFAVFPMYKWLLGPYSLAFLYVAPSWQNGVPLEQNSFNRVAPNGEYAEGAVRFDMGERDTFVGIPTALAALELASTWLRSDLRAHLRSLTSELATRLEDAGFQPLPRLNRSPHILGIRGVPHGVATVCRSAGVFFTQRHDSVRISPHAYNTSNDIERCASTLIHVSDVVRQRARLTP